MPCVGDKRIKAHSTSTIARGPFLSVLFLNDPGPLLCINVTLHQPSTYSNQKAYERN